jgi:4a-hydroxytetrahydrobiopterin dehydratase
MTANSGGSGGSLSADEVARRLIGLDGWEVQENALRRLFVFASFKDAVAFVVRLAFEAEATDHHPDLDIRYKRVLVCWSTHSAGGVTEKDFAGARSAETVAKGLLEKS